MGPSEIFISILYHFPLNVCEFSSDTAKLHRCFYELRRIYRGSFTEFTFDTRNTWPHSETLEGVIDGLIIAGIVWYRGLQSDHYEFSRETVNALYEKINPTLSKGRTSELKTMSQIFQQMLNVSCKKQQ